MSILAFAAVMVINTSTGAWQWLPASGPVSAYQVEVQPSGTTFTLARPPFELAPPDRSMTTLMRIRARATDGQNFGPWSEWSDYAGGVPVGYQPDATGDGAVDARDFDLWLRAFQDGWQWPR